jgi:peptidoglycan/LPS O-acetylase OafA/YrhL
VKQDATQQPRTRFARGKSERNVVIPVVALLGAEVLHMAATVANDGQPTAHHAQFGPPAHVAALLVTIGLLVWTVRKGPYASALATLAGAAVVVAALSYHVLPIESDFNNRFWGGTGASLPQQISVVVGIVAGIWCVVTGLRNR